MIKQDQDNNTIQYKGGRTIPEAKPLWQDKEPQQSNDNSKKE